VSQNQLEEHYPVRYLNDICRRSDTLFIVDVLGWEELAARPGYTARDMNTFGTLYPISTHMIERANSFG
jgi:hypothetical protein